MIFYKVRVAARGGLARGPWPGRVGGVAGECPGALGPANIITKVLFE